MNRPHPAELSPNRMRVAPVLICMIASWGVLIVAGVVALSMPDALGAAQPVSLTRSVFTSVNAATATGFSQQFAETEKFSQLVQAVLAAEAVGGLLLSLIGGGMILSRVFRSNISDGRIAFCAAMLIVAAAIVGLTSADGAGGPAVLRGVLALAGAGPPQQLHGWRPVAMQLALTPLALLGSLGVLWLGAVFQSDQAAVQLRRHVENVCAVAGSTFLFGIALTTIILVGGGEKLRSAASAASAIVLAARGFGAATGFASAWPRTAVWSAMAISIIGVGTLGAMPSPSLAWLFTFPRRLWRNILILLAIHGALSLTTMMILLQTEPQLSAERILLLVVSAAFKSGLSHEPVSITGAGLLAMAGLMTAAKLTPFGLILTVRNRATLPIASR